MALRQKWPELGGLEHSDVWTGHREVRGRRAAKAYLHLHFLLIDIPLLPAISFSVDRRGIRDKCQQLAYQRPSRMPWTPAGPERKLQHTIALNDYNLLLRSVAFISWFPPSSSPLPAPPPPPRTPGATRMFP